MSLSPVERQSIPDGLVHERDHTLIEPLGTVARVDLIRVGEMAHVIITIWLPVPAAGEHDLQPNPIRTVGIEIGLVWQEMSEQSRLGIFLVVEAVEAHRLLT